MTRSIIFIGAGIAGLSVGCYRQMNGSKTQIFELHDKPGGRQTAGRMYLRKRGVYWSL